MQKTDRLERVDTVRFNQKIDPFLPLSQVPPEMYNFSYMLYFTRSFLITYSLHLVVLYNAKISGVVDLHGVCSYGVYLT